MLGDSVDSSSSMYPDEIQNDYYKRENIFQNLFRKVYNGVLIDYLEIGQITFEKIKDYFETIEYNFINNGKRYYSELVNLDKSESYKQLSEQRYLLKKRGMCSYKLEPESGSLLMLSTEMDMNLEKISGSLERGLRRSKGVSEAFSCALGSITSPIFFAPGVNLSSVSVTKIKKYIKDLQILSNGSFGVIGVPKFVTEEKGGSSPTTNRAPFLIKMALVADPEDFYSFDSVHEAFVGIFAINYIRNLCPNFVFTYGYFWCSPPVFSNKKSAISKFDKSRKPDDREISSWCNFVDPDDNKNTLYIMLENLTNSSGNSPTVEAAILSSHKKSKNYNNNDYGVCDFLSTLSQVVCSLKIAWDTFEFTHYDLHSNNVILRETDDGGPIFIEYEFPSTKRKYFVRTNHIATIIDYGFSHIKLPNEGSGGDATRGVHYGTIPAVYNDFVKVGIFRKQGNQFADIFRFLCTSLYSFKHYYSNSKNRGSATAAGDYPALLSLLTPFATDSYDECDKIIDKLYDSFYHYPLLNGLSFRHDSFLERIQKVADVIGCEHRIIFSSKSELPPGAKIWKNDSSFEVTDFNAALSEIVTKDYNKVATSATPVFSPTSFSTFVDLFVTEKRHFAKRRVGEEGGSGQRRPLPFSVNFNFTATDAATAREIDEIGGVLEKNKTPYTPLHLIDRVQPIEQRYRKFYESLMSAFRFTKVLDCVNKVQNLGRDYKRACLILRRDPTAPGSSKTLESLTRFYESATQFVQDNYEQIARDRNLRKIGEDSYYQEKLFSSKKRGSPYTWSKVSKELPFATTIYNNTRDLYNHIFVDSPEEDVSVDKNISELLLR